MNIPSEFDAILKQDQTLYAEILHISTSFEPIYKDNKLYFFEEYTDHGLEHIEKVLKAAAFIIPKDSFKHIKSEEVAILLLAVLLHDIGMHLEFSTFRALLDGAYDDVRVKILDDKTWKELWGDYLSEAKHFSSLQKESIFGHPDIELKEPDLSNKDNLTGVDKKLIGEFVRRHHARLAHEIALKGFIGNNSTIPFGTPALKILDKKLAGIVARSHGIDVRDTFEYLKEIAYGVWKHPADMNIVFLMVLLRIADYLQIDSTRTAPNLLKLKTFNSPFSLREHHTHLAIACLTFENEDPELISVVCEPEDAQMYVKLKILIRSIQEELDMSWAILGEVYGFLPQNKPQIKFRRITSNLKHDSFLKKIDYIPQNVSFKVNNDLSKLLVAPLYGGQPRFGVRELVQNATDACKERYKIMQKDKSYEPLVTVSVQKSEDIEDEYVFKIKDNGKGMTLDEILNYFLVIGSSFRNSCQWKKDFASESDGYTVKRNGRFGIGVLAAFLIGDEISVATKSYKERYTYKFKTKIDSTYVDIKREETGQDCGTEIIIPISSQNKDAFLSKTSEKIAWNEWYINDFPKVEYYIESEPVVKKEIFKLERSMRTIFPKGYESITWGYQRKQSWGYAPTLIACNGIIVTESSDNSKFSVTSYNSMISRRPSLYIEDPQGILPLKLDRSEVDTEDFSFDDELLLDVSKDFIAQLLTLDVPSTEIGNIGILPHYTSFLRTKEGFCLSAPYMYEKLMQRNDEFLLLRILTAGFKIVCSQLFDIYPGLMILPEFNSEILLSQQTWNVAPYTGCRGMLRHNNFENLFCAGMNNRLNKWARERHSVEWRNSDYVIYNLLNYKNEPYILKEDSFVSMIDMNSDIQSIQEVPLNYLKHRTFKDGDVLKELFEEYFGDNVIIPYDMEKRKKMYAKAFEDLKEYM